MPYSKKKYRLIRSRSSRVWMESLEPRELLAASIMAIPQYEQEITASIRGISDLMGDHSLNSLTEKDIALESLKAAQIKGPRQKIGPQTLDNDLEGIVVMVV